MSDKLRPPRLFSDHKGYYIIDGSKKKRINYGIDNKNVVNVVIENCRTKQKRKKSKAIQQKKPPIVKQPSVQEQAMNPRYRLNQVLEQKLLAAQRQELRNREINLLKTTDNSLSALTKDGVTQYERSEQATLADQILGTQPAQHRAAPSDRGHPATPSDEDDYVAPREQGEPQQLIAEETDTKANQPPDDIEVDQLGNPILPGELQGPMMEDEKNPPEVKDIKALLNEYKGKIRSFLGYKRFKAPQIITLAKIYGYQPGDEGKQTPNESRDRAKEYLLDNADFGLKFIAGYKEDLLQNPAEYNRTPPMYKFMENLMSGRGKNTSLMVGLYNDQIDDMLRKYPHYVGCCSRDEIHKINLNDGVGGFIYNTVPSDKPTDKEGHWRAIYINVDDDKSIDHYDSFGEPAEQDIQEQVKQLLESYNLPYYLKWKDNKIINQRSNSSNCGWFCINFLQDRFEGIPFIDSTGFSTVMKSENKIKGLKKKFNYLV